MPGIHFNNLRVEFWEDEKGEQVVSRPLTPSEVSQVSEALHEILFEDPKDPNDFWESLYRQMFPDEPRWGEINWDEKITLEE